MKKAVLMVLVLLLLPVAFATTMHMEPIKDQISPFDTAAFSLTINNTGTSDKFIISYDDLDWSISTDPLTHYTTGIFVGAGHTITTKLLAKPAKSTVNEFRKHSLEITAKSENTDEELSSIIHVSVREDLIVYPLKVSAEFLLPEQIFPIKTNSVKVRLHNANAKNVSEINISVVSSLFEKQTTVMLNPDEEKIIDFSVTLDKLIPPQEDSATLKVTRGNITIAEVSKSYSIVPYGSFLSETKTEKVFLGKRVIATFTNVGNSEQTEAVLVESGKFCKRMFSRVNPAAKVTSVNDIAYYSTDLTLAPSESATVVVKTNYSPILYVIIVIVILLILYFAMRSPVIVAKEAKEVSVEEGGIARLSVMIKLKNRSKRKLKHVKIIDRVPSIAKVQIREKETMKPTKHYMYREGMVLEYDFGKVDPGEVRFITYHMKTKLAVVGDLRLRPVIVRFDGKKTYSNSVSVYTP